MNDVIGRNSSGLSYADAAKQSRLSVQEVIALWNKYGDATRTRQVLPAEVRGTGVSMTTTWGSDGIDWRIG